MTSLTRGAADRRVADAYTKSGVEGVIPRAAARPSGVASGDAELGHPDARAEAALAAGARARGGRATRRERRTPASWCRSQLA